MNSRPDVRHDDTDTRPVLGARLHDAAVRLGGNVLVADRVYRLLEALTDEQLATVNQELAEVCGRHTDGPLALVLHLLASPAVGEVHRRHELLEHARIQLEANGHEVAILFDAVAQDRDGAGWRIGCHCDAPEHNRRLPTYAAAKASGDEHIAATGGAWEDGAPWSEERCRDPWGYHDGR